MLMNLSRDFVTFREKMDGGKRGGTFLVPAFLYISIQRKNAQMEKKTRSRKCKRLTVHRDAGTKKYKKKKIASHWATLCRVPTEI